MTGSNGSAVAMKAALKIQYQLRAISHRKRTDVGENLTHVPDEITPPIRISIPSLELEMYVLEEFDSTYVSAAKKSWWCVCT